MAETSFLWTIGDDHFQGANLDAGRQLIKWYESAVPCLCGKMAVCECVQSATIQSFTRFEQDGPILTTVPAEVVIVAVPISFLVLQIQLQTIYCLVFEIRTGPNTPLM